MTKRECEFARKYANLGWDRNMRGGASIFCGMLGIFSLGFSVNLFASGFLTVELANMFIHPEKKSDTRYRRLIKYGSNPTTISAVSFL